MPTFNIQAPDGSTVKVDAPEGSTEEQAKKYVDSQYNSFKAKEAPEPKPQEQPKPQQNGVDPRVMARMIPQAGMVLGMAQGMATVAESIPNVLAKTAEILGVAPVASNTVQNAIKSQQDDFRKNYGYLPGSGLGQFAGEMMATAPLAALKIPGLAAKAPKIGAAVDSAIQGAAGGVATSPSSDQNVGTQAAEGAGFGAALGLALPPAAAKLIQKFPESAQKIAELFTGVKKAVDSEPAAVKQGIDALAKSGVQIGSLVEMTSEGPKIDFTKLKSMRSDDLKALGVTKGNIASLEKAGLGVLKPEELDRLLEYERNGITHYTLADLTGTSGDKTIEKSVIGKPEGVPVETKKVAGARELVGLSEQAKSQVLGQTDQFLAGKSVVEALGQKKIDADTYINAAYEKAKLNDRGMVLGATGNIPAQPINVTPLADILNVKNPLFASPEGKTLIRQVKSHLKDLGVIQEVGGGVNVRDITPNQAEQLVQFINKLYSPEKKALIKKMTGAVDESVLNSGQGKVFEEARFARQLKNVEFEKPELTSKVMEVVDGNRSIPYDKTVSTIVSAPENDLNNIKNTLLTGSKDNPARGQEAWDNIRATTFSNIIDSSVKDGVVNPEKLQKAIYENIGGRKMNILFSPEEMSSLNNLLKLSKQMSDKGVSKGAIKSGMMDMIEKIFPMPEQAVGGAAAERMINAKAPGVGSMVRRLTTPSAAEMAAQRQVTMARRSELMADPVKGLLTLRDAQTNQVKKQALTALIKSMRPAISRASAIGSRNVIDELTAE